MYSCEYVCKACGHFEPTITRPVICSNPQCPEPTAGFNLEWYEAADWENELRLDRLDEAEIEEYREMAEEEAWAWEDYWNDYDYIDGGLN